MTTTGNKITDAAESPLLNIDIVPSCVDFKGRDSIRSKSGCWKSAFFILSIEIAERFAFYGISSNLLTYLTTQLGQSTAVAAANVNMWSGMAWLLPLVGAFVADSFLGRYWMIIVASLVFILGLGFLTLSATFHSIVSSDCSQFELVFFFLSLYLVAIAQGGNKPCALAFGADQFDDQHQKESIAKSSFFNWWNFLLTATIFFSLLVLNYIQENVGWGLGFGIPCIVTCCSLIIFLLGTTTYRFPSKRDGRNPFLSISLVFIKAAKYWRATTPLAISIEVEGEGQRFLPCEGSQFKFLDKALLELDEEGKVSKSDIEVAKAILRLIPIWCTCLGFAIVNSQVSTMFLKQGLTMDRRITSNFQIPAASLQQCMSVSLIISIPIYDCILVPISQGITKKPIGISMLQRIGMGLISSLVTMIIAALIEIKRLAIANEYGLMDRPKETVPMSVWWLAPQYIVFGIAEMFTLIGLQEFFYDQVPCELKSIGLALYLSIIGIGNFLSSFLVWLIEKLTTKGQDQEGWFSDNLNRAHLDYFYWVLTGISLFSFVGYVFFAQNYVYTRKIKV